MFSSKCFYLHGVSAKAVLISGQIFGCGIGGNGYRDEVQHRTLKDKKRKKKRPRVGSECMIIDRDVWVVYISAECVYKSVIDNYQKFLFLHIYVLCCSLLELRARVVC
jgi:hypothetical protein